jgi:hypothetical protein
VASCLELYVLCLCVSVSVDVFVCGVFFFCTGALFLLNIMIRSSLACSRKKTRSQQ